MDIKNFNFDNDNKKYNLNRKFIFNNIYYLIVKLNLKIKIIIFNLIFFKFNFSKI